MFTPSFLDAAVDTESVSNIGSLQEQTTLKKKDSLDILKMFMKPGPKTFPDEFKEDRVFDIPEGCHKDSMHCPIFCSTGLKINSRGSFFLTIIKKIISNKRNNKICCLLTSL